MNANMNTPTSITIARSESDFAEARALMIEYRDQALGDDYHIGGNQLNEELEDLARHYSPPRGIFLLARRDSGISGCLALRPFQADAGEIVRMYVKPEARGNGIAEALMQALLSEARDLGYQTLYLDSLKRFAPAHRLYEKTGFTYCAPYDPHTTDDMREHMVFMRLDL